MQMMETNNSIFIPQNPYLPADLEDIVTDPFENPHGTFTSTSNETIGVFVDLNENNSIDNCQMVEPLVSPKVKCSEFPNIEVCFPKWQKVFPWVKFSSDENILFCVTCKKLICSISSESVSKSNIFQVKKPDDVFLVAKKLRKHNDSMVHNTGIYLSSYKSLYSLINIHGNLFQDIKSSQEAIDSIKVLFNTYESDIKNFIHSMVSIGEHAEKRIIKLIGECVYFSVVADQCRGLIIVKVVAKNYHIEEHVLWSYVTIYDQTPLQYLRNFDLDFTKLTIYIANAPCQQCTRCFTTRISPAQLPPRAPSVRFFSALLWQEDIMKPLLSVINTLSKLWKAYPFKFINKLNSFNIKTMQTHHMKPTVLFDMLDNFNVLKEISADIYENMSHVEALGLSKIKLQNDVRHRKVLMILEEIMEAVKEASDLEVITEKQIVKLNQTLGSLKHWSKGTCFVQFEGSAQQNTTTMRTNADKIYKLIQLVEQFIDENQKSFYYSGRDKLSAFYNICNTKSLLDDTGTFIDMVKLSNAFDVVHLAMSTFCPPSSKLATMESLASFHRRLIKDQKQTKNIVGVLEVFKKSPQFSKMYSAAYSIFLLNASMPFQPCFSEKNLFSSFVAEQKFESSIWNKLDKDSKPWFLYLHDELPNIPMKELLQWWLDSLD